jgi:hypothetical protein
VIAAIALAAVFMAFAQTNPLPANNIQFKVPSPPEGFSIAFSLEPFKAVTLSLVGQSAILSAVQVGGQPFGLLLSSANDTMVAGPQPEVKSLHLGSGMFLIFVASAERVLFGVDHVSQAMVEDEPIVDKVHERVFFSGGGEYQINLGPGTLGLRLEAALFAGAVELHDPEGQVHGSIGLHGDRLHVIARPAGTWRFVCTNACFGWLEPSSFELYPHPSH